MFVGTVIDFVAHLAVAGEGWSTMWTETAAESVALSSYGIAVGLRSASALLLLASTAKESSFTNRTPVLTQSRPMATVGAAAVTGSDTGQAFTAEFGWPDPPPEPGPLTYSTTSQDQPPAECVDLAGHGRQHRRSPRVVHLRRSHRQRRKPLDHGRVDMVHVVAGAVWAGGVLAFAIVLWRRHRRRLRLDALELAVRFSVIAGAALAAAGVAGTVLAVIILDSLSELWTTPWGLLLIAKFTAVVAAAGLGTFNHFVVIPWMEADPGDDSRSLMLRNTATGEAILLCVVLAVTAFLVGAASS